MTPLALRSVDPKARSRTRLHAASRMQKIEMQCIDPYGSFALLQDSVSCSTLSEPLSAPLKGALCLSPSALHRGWQQSIFNVYFTSQTDTMDLGQVACCMLHPFHNAGLVQYVLVLFLHISTVPSCSDCTYTHAMTFLLHVPQCHIHIPKHKTICLS